MLATQIRISSHECLRRKILSAYDSHHFIYSLFPRTEKRNFLYCDKGYAHGYKTFLVLSTERPREVEWCDVLTKEVPSRLFSYANYKFSVRLNPVFRHGSKSTPITGRADQGKWFLGKCPLWGFKVDQDQLLVSETTLQTIATEKHSLVQQGVVFTGVLEVVDSSLFKKSFEKGIGRSRGFGFGLLEIVPIA